MTIKSYKDLIVWQKGIELVEAVYRLTKMFPKEEIYGLTSQLRRAAVSVPSNIAEGQARSSTAEFVNFLSIARGSLSEVETQLIIAHRLEYLDTAQLNEVLSIHDEVSKILPALMEKLATGH